MAESFRVVLPEVGHLVSTRSGWSCESGAMAVDGCGQRLRMQGRVVVGPVLGRR